MKKLTGQYLENFRKSFQCERDRMHLQVWALPPDDRRYYLLEPYLFGFRPPINGFINVPSMARVLPTGDKLLSPGGVWCDFSQKSWCLSGSS